MTVLLDLKRTLLVDFVHLRDFGYIEWNSYGYHFTFIPGGFPCFFQYILPEELRREEYSADLTKQNPIIPSLKQ
jgi:hypothetical protein